MGDLNQDIDFIGPEFFHVTDRENAEEIVRSGFLGGWGDVGYGVYAFDNIVNAREYAANGGWDRQLVDPVIIVFSTLEMSKVIPEPSWPNPDDYLSVFWKELDDRNEEECWKPHKIEYIECFAGSKKKVTPC